MGTTRYKKETESIDVWHYAFVKQQPEKRIIYSKTLFHPETWITHHTKSYRGPPNQQCPPPQKCRHQQTEWTSSPANFELNYEV